MKKKIKKKSEYSELMDFLKKNEIAVFIISVFLVFFISIGWLSKTQNEDIIKNSENYNEKINFEENDNSKYNNNEYNLKEDLKETEILLNELLTFKDESDFHYYGFGGAYKYNKWLKKAGKLKQSSNSRKILSDYGFALGDLEMLGLEYVKTKGAESEYSLWAKKRIINGLVQK